MNIMGHIIKPECIHGIGPLMKEFGTGTDYALYNHFRFFFELHLAGHTTKINSDWVYTTAVTDSVYQSSRKSADKFKNEYIKAVDEIKKLIKYGFPVPIG